MTTPKKTAKTAPKNRPTQISAARKAAFEVLLAVERGHSHSDDLLRGKAVNALSAPDRNLATALVLGVLRWQIQLDHQLHALLARPNAKLDPEVLIALRMGAFQLLHMDRIPARAVLSESVELTKQAGHRFASAMVNAVLRKLAEGAPSFGSLDDIAAKLALEESHPAWMVERWITSYGLEATRSICRHGQTQPVLSIRLATPSVETELGGTGIILEAGELLTAARSVAAGDITATEAFGESRVRLQDEGSQLVAELACENLDQKVKNILDACAAPGGKTMILVERNPEAHIVACDSSLQRFEQLRVRLAGFGNQIECRHAEANALTEDSVYDLALADVPCSGTGTLGRNPEIRHRLRPDDLTRQAERQREILTAALRAVRPGGRVVYSTCSLEPEENEQVIAAVLAATPNLRTLPLQASIDALLRKAILTENGANSLRHSLTPEGFLRLLPGAFHTDGFFIALIERIAG
ncbi:MAG: 16S rRNA (cytosine(967)-C(5))-methyltransferase RsmB [Terracidiphilus sp.]|jgi:16S rRNA (cytosine967-C5)-methyltransferase